MTRQRLFVCWVAGSAALMVIGAFGPWLKILGVSVKGTQGQNDGRLIVAFAVLAAAAFLLIRRSMLAAIPAIVGGALASYVTIDNRRILDDAEAAGIWEIGWGLNVALLASVSLGISGLAWLLTFKQPAGAAQDLAPPAVPAAPDEHA
jgi:hypothetical protein